MLLLDESEVDTFHQVRRDSVRGTGTDPGVLT